MNGAEAEQVRREAEAVLAEEVYWFPVRHHSPEVARHLAHAIRARRPSVIFLEAPSDAEELVPHVVDPKTKPPVALYASYRDDDDVLGLRGIDSPAADVPVKYASFYPLLPYSPEYVAMKEAAKIGARVVFIDLPSYALAKTREERGLPAKDAPPNDPPDAKASENAKDPKEPQEDADETATVEEDQTEDAEEASPEASDESEQVAAVSSWERLAMTSSFYTELARASGYRSWDECWDTLFETPQRFASYEDFRAELAHFCAALRATTSHERMLADGTLHREAHMLERMQRTFAETGVAPERAMVVCGGFHLFMSREPGPKREWPKGSVYRTVTPYSYARTSELSGYGAGNRAPAYYARLYEHALDDPAEAPVRAMVDHVVAVLRRARSGGETLSAADAISVTQHARMLANLRGRTTPSLDDVRDGLVSCCCKGSMAEQGRLLGLAMAAIETGNAVGRVTPALGRLPLVHDFYRWIDELELGETIAKDGKRKLSLDLRSEADERRSAFFHRLAQLEIPYVELVSAGRESTLFREVWRLAWTPKVDAELAEQNLHGDSVEAAALARLDEELAKGGQGADEITGRLLRAVRMDLPGMVQRLLQVAGEAVDADARLAPLARALTDLTILESHTKRKGLRSELVAELAQRCFARACFAVPHAANVPSEEHVGVVHAIKSLVEVATGERGQDFDRDLLVESVKASRAESTAPYLQGALSGVLTELRVQSTDNLADEVRAFSRAGPEVLVTVGEFLNGMLATCRTAVLLGADAIVGAIDELLKAAAWEQFLVLLPRARGAFEAMHDRTRVSLADRVAVRYGLTVEAADTIAKLETSSDAATRLVALDAKVAEMMKAWDF